MKTLTEINARLKPIEIKGKQYVPVNQRILGFWEFCPIGSELSGAIITEILKDDGKRCDVKASVYIGGTLISTGHAFEFHDAGMVNKTSYVENAETSAIGRALGVLGIGCTESLASAEEMQNALAHQENLNAGAQRDTAPQIDDYTKAKQRLWSAAKAFATLQGMEPKAWFAENIQARTDFEDSAECFERIADEIEEVMVMHQ